jgi:hypothetical protein
MLLRLREWKKVFIFVKNKDEKSDVQDLGSTKLPILS